VAVAVPARVVGQRRQVDVGDDAPEAGAEEPPPGTAEGLGDPTPERDAEPAEPEAEPEREPVEEPA
jgi:hypothetical protein